MEKIIISLILCMQLMLPIIAHAQMALKTPLSYNWQEYAIVLSTALLGGFAGWLAKVRRGEVMAWNLAALIGELCVSAFAGVLAFWLCEWANLHPLLTASVVGISGHAGAKGLSWIESIGRQIAEKRLGIVEGKSDAAKNCPHAPAGDCAKGPPA